MSRSDKIEALTCVTVDYKSTTLHNVEYGLQIPLLETFLLAPHLLLLLLQLRLICFHGSSVLFDGHFFSCWHSFSHFLSLRTFVLCVHLLSLSLPNYLCLPFNQSFQVMLSSLHSELDIQRFLMKIQSPRRVSRRLPFICILLKWCWCVCAFMHLH